MLWIKSSKKTTMNIFHRRNHFNIVTIEFSSSKHPYNFPLKLQKTAEKCKKYIVFGYLYNTNNNNDNYTFIHQIHTSRLMCSKDSSLNVSTNTNILLFKVITVFLFYLHIFSFCICTKTKTEKRICIQLYGFLCLGILDMTSFRLQTFLVGDGDRLSPTFGSGSILSGCLVASADVFRLGFSWPADGSDD
ncbi:hypothetical protein AGLY_009205 [Aphis glycines]|uniref:Transmembrane protein n=1 Tax=Aphis glycines TaxID=307491 RepID=A0A6G0TJX5_APHGL|nr:hypothetical protein AGLY_009205 [Aphis glycines]